MFVVPPRFRENQYREIVPVAYNLGHDCFVIADYEKHPDFYTAKYSYDLGHLMHLELLFLPKSLQVKQTSCQLG